MKINERFPLGHDTHCKANLLYNQSYKRKVKVDRDKMDILKISAIKSDIFLVINIIHVELCSLFVVFFPSFIINVKCDTKVLHHSHVFFNLVEKRCKYINILFVLIEFLRSSIYRTYLQTFNIKTEYKALYLFNFDNLLILIIF